MEWTLQYKSVTRTVPRFVSANRVNAERSFEGWNPTRVL